MYSFLKGRTILVVEDEETNWFLLRDILESFQAITTWAELGSKAIDLIKSGAKFDAVLMDINLPAMDGYEVTRRIKAIRPDIPVIAQTAFALDSEIENCYQAGCSAHVIKPFTIAELTEALRGVLTVK
jgi:two-component system, cell cycle response regulator DivK